MASAAFEDIVEDFEFLEDWEDRYRYVIEKGKTVWSGTSAELKENEELQERYLGV